MLPILGLAVAAFISTNLDDIFILMLFFADRRYPPRQILAGHFLGITLLVALSVVGALVALLIPTEWIRFMGLLPIAIGLKQLYDLWRGKDDDDELPAENRSGRSLYFLTVLSVTFANGGDNVGVYIPMFASLTVAKLVLTVLVFTLMSIIWCGIAYYLVRHTRVGDQMRRFGDRLMPIVLIILGLLILADAF